MPGKVRLVGWATFVINTETKCLTLLTQLSSTISVPKQVYLMSESTTSFIQEQKSYHIDLMS